MRKKTLRVSQVKLLWGKSGGRCAVCKEPLHEAARSGRDFPVGEMAHIEGENPGSARFNPGMNDAERNAYDNLILLCPTHHTVIDKDVSQFTVGELSRIKKEHEKWVEDSLRSHIADISFVELDVLLQYLVAAPIMLGGEPVAVIPPAKKIKKNDLSDAVGNLITLGMLQAKLIESYLNQHPDTDFSRRLNRGFVDKYDALRKDELEGDALFFELHDYSSNRSMDFRIKTAGLSVLAYFFEKCKVFES